MSIPSFFYSIGSAAGTVAGAVLSGKALPIGRDLALDPITHDLLLSGGDLSLVADREAIRQEADIRLNFLLGEWFLDITKGVPMFQKVLVKSPDLTAIRSILADEILEVAGIRSILSLVLDYNRTARTLKVTWKANSDVGELASTVTLET